MPREQRARRGSDRLKHCGSGLSAASGRTPGEPEDEPRHDWTLCFFAGANSMFCGERLLTASNPSPDADRRLFGRLGLQPED